MNLKEYFSKPKHVRKLINHISYCQSAIYALERKPRFGKNNPGYFRDQIKKTEKLLKQIK
jgi:hypothetical protein